MTRILFLLALLGFIAPVSRAATNSWDAPISVTVEATKIRITSIQINTPPGAPLNVVVSWAWTDSAGKIVRSGVTRYTEAQIAAKLTAYGSSVDAFKQLFLAIAAAEAIAP